MQFLFINEAVLVMIYFIEYFTDMTLIEKMEWANYCLSRFNLFILYIIKMESYVCFIFSKEI